MTARRLAPDVRKAEIIARTREMISTQGVEGLSLREVARWCDISAPGLLHHFDGLKGVLEAMLTQRAQEQLRIYAAAIESLGDRARLRDLADATVGIAVEQAPGNRNFDRLELLALADPSHPANEYFVNGNDMQFLRPMARELAEREYHNAESVSSVLGLVADGLRLRWLRSATPPDYWGDWAAVRDTVFDGFEPFRRAALPE